MEKKDSNFEGKKDKSSSIQILNNSKKIKKINEDDKKHDLKYKKAVRRAALIPELKSKKFLEKYKLKKKKLI